LQINLTKTIDDCCHRVSNIIDTNDLVQDTGTEIAPPFKGSIFIDKVRFSYIPEEEVLKGISFMQIPEKQLQLLIYRCRKNQP
jgi:ABC-type multidrug transport system fused ATPase/permease subunit